MSLAQRRGPPAAASREYELQNVELGRPHTHIIRPADRVRRQADFDRVYQARFYAADQVLVVQGCANGLARTRLGALRLAPRW